MPKNFQISQYDEPLCTDGYLDVEINGEVVRVGIERVHLEEDTGKSLHVGGSTGRIHGATHSLVDYNRAGIPLVEIVTKPVPGTGALAPEVARAYVTELRETLRALDVSDVRMEEGSLRCDVNLSLNVNRRARVGHAQRDQERQLAALGRARGSVGDRTAGRRARQRWPGQARDAALPRRQRPHRRPVEAKSKPRTTATFPSPIWCRSRRRPTGSKSCARRLPELPFDRRRRLRDEWGITPLDMQAALNAGAVESIEATVALGVPARDAYKWWMGELARQANERAVEVADLPITPAQVARIVALVADGTLNDKLARQVLEAWWRARAIPTRWSPPAGWRSCRTTGRWARRSTPPSRPIPRWRKRCATARSPRPARSSAR